jgi:hypothetical protein
MKTALRLLAFVFSVCFASSAQVVPAATQGGSHLGYSLRYSQAAGFYGAGLGTTNYGITSGNLEYRNGSERRPFNMNFGGGYAWALSGSPFQAGFFENLWLSQGLVGRKWNAQISDQVSYAPEAPTGGFSGISGTGEPIGVPPPTPPTSQSILTLNTHVVNNVALANYEHNLDYATSLTIGGGYTLLRYPDGNGLNITSENGDAGLARRLDARNSISGQYVYSYFSYPDYNANIQTSTALLGYNHQLNRQFDLKLAAGPEWISASGISGLQPTTTVAANAMIAYQMRSASASLSYSRGTNGGGGFLLGGVSDAAFGNFSREFGRDLTLAMTGGYQRTTGLGNNDVISNAFGEAQVTRRLGDNFTVFANYTGTDQSTNAALPSNVLTQFYQVIGFGVGFSPREMRLRQ